MEYKKKDMYLQLENSKGAGWTKVASPNVKPLKMPEPVIIPAPLPEAPVTHPAAQLAGGCGYCAVPGICYVPVQQWEGLYEAEEGFSRGTIFEALDYPFMGKGDCRHE